MCSLKEKCGISVIVADYNPEIQKLKATLLSIIEQEGVSFEIIVTDDGSLKDQFDEIKEFFAKYHFDRYILVKNKKNEGTVRNLIHGLRQASGKYFKGISPGDCLFDSSTLKDWYEFAEKHDADVIFGDSILYSCSNDNLATVKAKKHPQMPLIYDYRNHDLNGKVSRYVLMQDAIFGCQFLIKKDFALRYLEEASHYVRFAEDMMYRAMIVRDERFLYFNRNILWYEYGTGISTAKNDKWDRIIENERKNSDAMLLDKNSLTGLYKIRFQSFLRNRNRYDRITKYLYFPELIWFALLKRKDIRYTDTDVDLKQLEHYFKRS